MALVVNGIDGQIVIPDEDEELIDNWQPGEQKTIELNGQCRVSIKFNNRAEYLRWCKYIDPYANRWDFEVSFPAIMRKTYLFKNSLDVEMMMKQLISLLQMGFSVSMANFELDQKEVALETSPNVEDEDP